MFVSQITEQLRLYGFTIYEGYSQLNIDQTNDLLLLSSNCDKKEFHIMEIGFNAGHSAEIFLKSRENTIVTSFDIGTHNYLNTAKNIIDENFPDRHTLIIGDSTSTIPQYIADNKDKKFDLIFIDGGHDYEVAKADIDNCFYLAHKDTIVIVDDTIFTMREFEYSIGPTKAWLESVNENKIIELQRKEYCEGHGMAWGRYNISP